MKKIISIILSVIMICTWFCTFAGFELIAAENEETSFSLRSSATIEDLVVPSERDGRKVTEVDLQNAHSLRTVFIPETVKTITVVNCPNITAFSVDENNPYFSCIDGVIYNSEITELCCYPAGSEKIMFETPKSVERIADYAFYNAQQLEYVSLPGVVSIGYEAFFNASLKSVVLSEKLTDIEFRAFAYNSSLKSIILPASLERVLRPFYECSALSEVVVLHKELNLHRYSSNIYPEDDDYSELLSGCKDVTVYVPDAALEDYMYYKGWWGYENEMLPLSEYPVTDFYGKEELTLSDVIRLSKKGDNLTWNNFTRYKYTDIGTETPAYQFTLNGYKLLIEGSNTETKPEHIYLVDRNGRKADIRSEDFDLFLSHPVMFIISSPNDSSAGSTITIINDIGYVYKVPVDDDTIKTLTSYRTFESIILKNMIKDIEPEMVLTESTAEELNQSMGLFYSSLNYDLVDWTEYKNDSASVKVFLADDKLLYEVADIGSNSLWLDHGHIQPLLIHLIEEGCLNAVPAETTVSGDVNGDGTFGIADAVLLQKWLLAVPGTELNDWRAADLNSDNSVDAFDMVFMRNKIVSE